jgi:polyisoprenoid-binding protein YceI
VRHLVSKTHGRFADYTGTIAFDPADHKTAVVNLEIDAASIKTDSEKRDGHLKSGDFFEVEKYPTITFVSTGVKPLTADTGVLTGDLTMKGITKPVELQYTILGQGQGMRGKVLGLEATGKINRKDFNVLWNKDMDKGATLLGDDVNLDITVEAVEDVPPPAAPAKTN